MSERQWEKSVKHAKTCIIGEERYLYRRQSYAVIMNPICEVVGLMINDDITTPQQLSQEQMVRIQFRNHFFWPSELCMHGILIYIDNIQFFFAGRFPAAGPGGILQ